MSSQPINAAGTYLLSRIPAGAPAKDFFQTYALGSSDLAALSAAATEDASRYAYSGVASFLGGVSSLHTRQFAWAVTKLYYSAFYVARAVLCRNGKIFFHAPKPAGGGHTQYEISAALGGMATSGGSPSTHKIVAARFKQIGYPSFMQSLVIDGSDPIAWLTDQREYWQYRAARFPDPNSPAVLDRIEIEKIQKHLAAYESDPTGVYLADPGHAVVALPFRLVAWSLSVNFLRGSAVITTEDLAYLSKMCLVGKQKMTAISKLL